MKPDNRMTELEKLIVDLCIDHQPHPITTGALISAVKAGNRQQSVKGGSNRGGYQLWIITMYRERNGVQASPVPQKNT